MSRWWPSENERPWGPDEPMPADWVAGEAEWKTRVAAWRRINAARAARRREDADHIRRLTGGRLEGRSGVHLGGIGWVGHHVTKAERKRARKAERQARAEEAERQIRSERDVAAKTAAVLDRAERSERRDAEVDFARRTGVPFPPAVVEPALSASTIRVGDELAPYGEGSSFSWFRDAVVATGYGWGAIPLGGTRSADLPGAVADRLSRNGEMMRRLGRSTADARRLYLAYFRELTRAWMGTISDRGEANFRAWAMSEVREGTTATGSLGQFTPPVFVLQEFEPYRTPAAATASQCEQLELPKTGMSVTRPVFGSQISVTVQATEGATLAASTPTVSYVKSPVLTLGSSVTLSQQLLDRFGPGVTADQALVAQAREDAATRLDSEVIAAILTATPQTLTNAGTSPSVASLWTDVNEASSKIEIEPGVRLSADTTVMPPQVARWFMAQTDTQKRPIWTPTAAGTAGRVGAPDTSLEGYMGTDLAGTRLMGDSNALLKTGTTGAIVLVGALGRAVSVYKASPVIRIIPQIQGATKLSVLAVFTLYAAISVPYPRGVVKVTSSTGAYPWTPTF